MDDNDREELVTKMRQEEVQRQSGYREQALKLFPHVCARCTRDFTVKNLRELTVHHKDHNHDNNPPNGNNWELLCLYCHDHEHTRGIQVDREIDPTESSKPTLAHSPFAGLSKKFNRDS